jgi:hypothetical protein
MNWTSINRRIIVQSHINQREHIFQDVEAQANRCVYVNFLDIRIVGRIERDTASKTFLSAANARHLIHETIGREMQDQ